MAYKFWNRAFSLAIALVFLLTISTHVSAKNEVVSILILDWSSQEVLSYITGALLQKKGIDIEYHKASSDGQWYLLDSNTAQIQMEVWEGTMATRFNELVKEKKIVDAGTHNAVTREDWWYPAYVKELCPGLPDWIALNNCAELFAKDQSNKKGLYFTGPWESTDDARIRALKMNFDVVKVSSGVALRKKLKNAVELKKPIVLFNWTPNWIDVEIDGEFVEFPNYEMRCEHDASWGYSTEYAWDCGNPKDGWLKKAVSVQLESMSPCANAIVKAISFSNKDIANATAYVVEHDMLPKDAAIHWLENNPDVWRPWLEKTSSPCNLPGWVFPKAFEDIRYISEQFPPYNYINDAGVAAGLNTDLLLAMFKVMGSRQTESDIEFLPWVRGYRRVQSKEKTNVLFSTVRKPSREKLFKWVGPISTDSTGLITLKGNPHKIRISSDEDYAKYTYGVIRDDIGEVKLIENGVSLNQIHKTTKLVPLIRMLKANRFEAIAYHGAVAMWTIKSNGFSTKDFEILYEIELGKHYFAFNKSVPDHIVKAHQEALDKVQGDKVLMQEIRDKYLK